ncbi:MAG: glycosyltransferase family 1 protein [Patescibacteria group bacterium]
MLIGIDASRANRALKSGTEWYSYYLILELAKIDRKNRYFLYTPEKLRGELTNLPKNFEEKILSWPPKKLWTMARLSFEMLIAPLDLLFVPAHIIPIISPKNTLTAIHDLGFLRYPQFYSKKELKYHRFGLRQAIKKAIKIITISEFSKKELIELCCMPSEKIEVIYLGFSPKYKQILDRQKTETILEKYHIPKNIPYILYIGRLEYKKNTPRLISAFAKFKKLNPELRHKLVLVGSFGVGKEEVFKNIKKYNLEKEVIMPGWIIEDDLSYILSGASLFVFPSLYEGFGIPILEAMAACVPVCAAARASIPEVAGRAALFFDPENEEEMAKSIEKILKNLNLQKELKEKGKKRASAFSWEKCARRTLKVLESCR